METKNRFKLIGVLALCLFVVPLVGWWTGQYSESRFDVQVRDLVVNDWKKLTAEEFDAWPIGYVPFCAQLKTSKYAGQAVDEFCRQADEISFVKTASLGTAVVGTLLFLLILGGRLIAGTDRKRMSVVFGPLIRVVMLLLAISVLAQGLLFGYSLYTIEVTATHKVHTAVLVFIGLIGLGALAACWVLLSASIGFMRREPMLLRGLELDKAAQQGLFAFISEIAAKLKSQMPDHVVVGLEPNFFVTATDVKLVGTGQVLKGRTLFLSLGLLRTFTKPELAAVIGHEFAHFLGDDVAYSLKFAPTYTRLGRAISELGSTAGNVSDFFREPAVVALSICRLVFSAAERSVGRERELLADKAGAEASDAMSLTRALVKVSLYGGQWETVTNALTDEIVKGNSFTNVAQVYAGLCQNTVSGIDWASARDLLGKYVQPHPVDTHPPLTTRLQGLNTTLSDINQSDLLPPEVSASELINDAERMERELSDLEARWLVAIGAVIPPAPFRTT